MLTGACFPIGQLHWTPGDQLLTPPPPPTPAANSTSFTIVCVAQVVNKKLKDTKGGYAQFLRENVGEAKVMEEKEKRVKVLEQSTVKAKSKVSCTLSCEQQGQLSQASKNTRIPVLHQNVTAIPSSMQSTCGRRTAFDQGLRYLWLWLLYAMMGPNAAFHF